MNLPMNIDNEPIRAREVRRAKDWIRKLEQFDAAVDRFEQIDRQRYGEWHERTFGPLLTEVELRRRELALLADVHNEVVCLVNMEGLFAAEAYQIIRDEHRRYALGDPAVRAEIDRLRAKRRAWLDGEPEPESEDDERDRVGEQTEFNFSMGPDEDDDDEDDWADASDEPAAPRARPVESPGAEAHRLRLKSLFRAIARKIHPDAVEGILAKKGPTWLRRTWTRAVVAEERGDLNQLIVIHGQIMVAARELLSLNVTELRAMTAALTQTYARRQAESGRIKSAPAWNFSKLKSTKKLETQVGRSYRAALRDYQAQIQELREYRAAWEFMSTSARGNGGQRKRRRRG